MRIRRNSHVPVPHLSERTSAHRVINVSQVLPVLQTDNEEAAVALNCGLSTPAWANDELQFVYTYTREIIHSTSSNNLPWGLR